MTHNSLCENAKPKSRCRCSCGGRYHGRARFGEEDYAIIPVNGNIGGDLGKTVKTLKKLSFKCWCGRKTSLNDFYAYPHEGGLAKAEKGEMK